MNGGVFVGNEIQLKPSLQGRLQPFTRFLGFDNSDGGQLANACERDNCRQSIQRLSL